jgi:bifunctional DNA-binding transcriptional regulator/antitoxin component of YhaV-PrlF toxin-antitoxin module
MYVYLINRLVKYIIACNNIIMHTKMTKRGQVSVPSVVRKKLQIGPETRLEWVVEGNTAKIIPLPADPLKAFRGSGTPGLAKKLLDERKKDRVAEDVE